MSMRGHCGKQRENRLSKQTQTRTLSQELIVDVRQWDACRATERRAKDLGCEQAGEGDSVATEVCEAGFRFRCPRAGSGQQRPVNIDGPTALRDVSLKISAGQVIGIVGPSGSRRSTLTQLAQRLYVPESGQILIYGVDLTVADVSWLRGQVGSFLQENVLFNRPIRDNVALSDSGMVRVIAAAELARAHEFI
jgi:ABC-type multidrug transport system fused ATPase/permease subunit